MAFIFLYRDLLQFRVELFASLQGSPQHCSLWVNPHVLLRPTEQHNLRLTEGLPAGRMLVERRPGGAWDRRSTDKVCINVLAAIGQRTSAQRAGFIDCRI